MTSSIRIQIPGMPNLLSNLLLLVNSELCKAGKTCLEYDSTG